MNALLLVLMMLGRTLASLVSSLDFEEMDRVYSQSTQNTLLKDFSDYQRNGVMQ